jgi:sugar lactone lactonase YvrE
MRLVLRVLGGALALLVLYLLFWPVPIAPVAWTPPPNPGFTGRFAPNDALAAATPLLAGVGVGPEDVARDGAGLLYTGFADGRIVRFPVDRPDAVEEFANTGGRPLGLDFDAAGTLIVADALRGLLAVDPAGRVTVLTDSVDGARMQFVDDVAVATDGRIWFSDGSRFGLHDAFDMLLDRRATGRVLVYDPRTRATTVALTGLVFANGVALGPDDAFLLVNDSFAYRIVRLWLTGPRAGEHEPFFEALPGCPDNVTFNGRDRFWVAHFIPRTSLLDLFPATPFLRTVVYRALRLLPTPDPPRYGFVLGLDLAGNVVANLQDPSGGTGMLTSAREIDGALVLGNFATSSLLRLPLP